MHWSSEECEALKEWFLSVQRDLPWRQQRDPYAVWVSEVMLQQTQVAVVLPYFLRWMKRFPAIQDLATASLDEVLKLWEGLGYYSRVRHLHSAAKYLVTHFQGNIPSREEELKKIKGLGPYTVAAILSFAFHQKIAVIDGNVLRVLTRYCGIREDISKSSTVKQLRLLAHHLLPEEEHWIVNEAFMELGATVCQRKAQCDLCPLQPSCVSYKEGLVDRLPIKSKRVATEYLYRGVVVLKCGSHYLVKREQKGKIMADLYEFPYFELAQSGIREQQLRMRWEETYALKIEYKESMAEVRQSFTRYQAFLYPMLFTCHEQKSIVGLQWLSLNALQQMAFSSGHRRILQQLTC